MGAGKTTVGVLLGARLQRPCLDLDAEMVGATGHSIAALWRLHGEAAYREMELAALRAALAQPQPQVVATGGGALLSEGAWQALDGRAVTVHLGASLTVLQQRLDSPAARAARPLWPATAAALEALWLARLPTYARCTLQIATDQLSPVEVADQIVAALP